MAAKKTTNGTNGRTNGNGHAVHNGHVSLAREEYDAYRALDERVSEQAIENAKLANRNAEISSTMSMQAQHLSGMELKIMHLERVTSLQGVLIDSLKNKDKILGLAELSEFWRQWTIFVANQIDAGKLARPEAEKFEPDLFKMWRNWVNDYGKQNRGLSIAGTRAEYEASVPQTQTMMQAHLIARQREEIAVLAAKVQQLETELGPLQAAAKPVEVKQ